MKIERKHLFLIGLAICLIPFVLGTIYYSRMPEQMATHFDFAGRPDHYSSRLHALFGLPAIMIGLYGLLYFFTLNDPRRRNQSEKMVAVSLICFPLISLGLSILTIAVSLGYEVNIRFYMQLIAGVLLIVIANYLPKVKSNYTVGIRLPWTLADPEIWERTHRLAAWIWGFGGLLILLGLLAPQTMQKWVWILVLPTLVILPMGYAYCLYQKKQKDQLPEK